MVRASATNVPAGVARIGLCVFLFLATAVSADDASLAGCQDNDTDGVTTCDGDCDDTNPATYPGAQESNDGEDNQCPGEPGFGLVDETSGLSGFHNPAEPREYSWPAQPGATLYEVATSSWFYPLFSLCSVVTSPGTPVLVDLPAPGGLRFHLNRPIAPQAGSWGSASDGTERIVSCP